MTDNNIVAIPTTHTLVCQCGVPWAVDGVRSFTCTCGMRYSDIRTEPVFQFSIDDLDGLEAWT